MKTFEFSIKSLHKKKGIYEKGFFKKVGIQFLFVVFLVVFGITMTGRLSNPAIAKMVPATAIGIVGSASGAKKRLSPSFFLVMIYFMQSERSAQRRHVPCQYHRIASSSG